MGKQQLRRFYVRRVFRTFPSYWVVLTFLSLYFTLTPQQREHLPWEYCYVTNFLDLGRTSVVMPWGWSLALEEQFYLTVPLLFFVMWKLRSNLARVLFLAGVTLSCLAIRLGIYFHGLPWRDRELYEALYFRTHTRFDTLIAGVLLAVVHRTWGTSIGAWLKSPFHRALIALPCAGLFWVCTDPTVFGVDVAQFVRVLAWGSLTAVMHFGVVTLLLHGDGPVHRFLSSPVFRKTATLGYGIYLVHIPIIHHVVVPMMAKLHEQHGTSMWLVWPGTLLAVLALSYVVAYGLHLVIEKPALRLREKLAA